MQRFVESSFGCESECETELRKCHLLSDDVLVSIITSIVFFAQINAQILWEGEGNSC
jgi:hypothetical protein